MNALGTLASLGLTLHASGDDLKMTGLASLPEGQVQYALRLAKTNKHEIVRELYESQNALASLIAFLHKTPGVWLHFHALEPVPAYSLQFEEEASFEDCMKARRLFGQAIDAIHFNASSTAKALRPSAFDWPE